MNTECKRDPQPISSEILGPSVEKSQHDEETTSLETHRKHATVSSPMSSGNNKKLKRELCPRCQRPKARACLCPWLPEQPLALVSTSIVVLQHPHEFKHKSNRSVPLLELCFPQPPLYLCVGRRLGEQLPLEIQALLQPPNLPILIFPSLKDEASQVLSLVQVQQKVAEWRTQQQQHLDTLISSQPKIVLLVLDATWKFAKEMHRSNREHYPSHMLRMALQGNNDLPNNFQPRRFEIRTTPSTDHDDASASWMCTAECVAWITSQLEQQSQPHNRIYETVLQLIDAAVQQHNSFVVGNKRVRTHGSNDASLPPPKKTESTHVP